MEYPERTPSEILVPASSITSIVEAPGQSNYSTANTFLESFCECRSQIDLPAYVIRIAPISDHGYISETSTAKRSIEAQGIAFSTVQEFLQSLELAIILSGNDPQQCPNGRLLA
jgi:hypothetical protein